MAGFYFAWVNATDTTFTGAMQVEDEEIVSFKIDHAEGAIPTLTIDVRNPRIGLLSAGRKVWAWLAWDDGTSAGALPIFFGRLVGIPDDLFGEVVSLRFIAKPADYQSRRQQVASTLKVAPYYDPLFLTDTRRDDPDAILEGYSALWHVDRLASDVTISDVLEGEDGTEAFTADDVPYDSVRVTLGQPPLSTVAVVGSVSWSQTASGYIDFGGYSFETYSGDGILSDWPKPLASLGGGWTVAFSTASDVNGVENVQSTNYSYEWKNSARKHANGDVLSVSQSSSEPILPGGSISEVMTTQTQSGALDPFALDEDGDPAPINIPMSASTSSTFIPKWHVRTTLVLRYDAERQRQERVHFRLSADLQSIITDPDVDQVTELIELQGADVGEPILNALNWSSVAGQAVTLGTVIFPDVVTLPDQRTAQICTTAGTADTISPDFSNIAGVTTTDGTVVWTSLGTSTPSASAQDWTAETPVPLGQMVLPRRPVEIAWTTVASAGVLQIPQQGVAVSYGQIVRGSNGSWQFCTLSGETGIAEPSFSTTWGVTTADGSAEWTSLGTTVASGADFFICTSAGTSDQLPPPWIATIGAETTDGDVTWTAVGLADVPVGGYPGNTPADCYFPTDRGLQSVEYLLCVARAHIRARARPVQISWDCRFDRALALSCRMNASIADPRLPGGTATGKITSYSIIADGDSGKLSASVTINSAVGYGLALAAADGTPSYVDVGYVDIGWQFYEAATVLAASDEIGYTPPARGVYDDGLVFPATRGQVVEFETTHGSLAAQEAGIRSALASAKAAATGGGIYANAAALEIAKQRAAAEAAQNTVANQLKANPIWHELQLLSLSGGPFSAQYVVETEPLVVPQQINLEASA